MSSQMMGMDDEAGKELRKMVAFIMQEAAEKSREINVKADEEFNIEKAKLVRQETTAIEQQFERKIKQAEVKRKIAQSNQVNKSRLRVLQAQDQAIDSIIEEAKQRLASIPSSNNYVAFMAGVMLQAFYRFMDGTNTEQLTVVLQVRKTDLAVAKTALNQALDQFKQATGSTLKSAKIQEDHFLDDSCLGGIVAEAMNGRIRLENTLTARLALATEALLPVVRTELFGASEIRKFYS